VAFFGHSRTLQLVRHRPRDSRDRAIAELIDDRLAESEIAYRCIAQKTFVACGRGIAASNDAHLIGTNDYGIVGEERTNRSGDAIRAFMRPDLV